MNEKPQLAGAWRRAARGAGLLADDGTAQPTIFAEMSALASRTGALNLGQGFPDEDGPAAVLEAARTAIAQGVNQYPPGPGDPALRRAIAAHQQHWYGIELDPEQEILVTAGATEALAATLLALIDGPDDEIVVFEPFYDAYAATIALAGARLVPVPLAWPDFEPDLDLLRRAVTDRTRVILVNDPHNPTGAVFSADSRAEIVRLAAQHDAIIVTDEVYEHLVFDGPHMPIGAMPGAAERTLTISSAGKTFAVTGWKVGWVSGPRRLVAAVLAVKQFLTYAGGAPFQPAVAVGLALGDEFFTALAADMRRKRDVLATGLAAAGFLTAPSAGSYFTVADMRAWGDDAAAFCRELPARAGVVAIPLTAFVTSPHRERYATLVRFAACKRIDVIDEAMTRLQAL